MGGELVGAPWYVVVQVILPGSSGVPGATRTENESWLRTRAPAGTLPKDTVPSPSFRPFVPVAVPLALDAVASPELMTSTVYAFSTEFLLMTVVETSR